MGLPFLVEWGEWVWQGAFATLLVAGALWAWWTPRRQSRSEAHAWCPNPTPVDRYEEGADAIVEGPLAQSTSRSVLVPTAAIAGIASGPDFASDQLPLVIETEGGLVELSGPIRLMVGGVEQRPLRTFRRASPLHARVCALPDGPPLAAKLEGRRYVIKSISPGATVRALGLLRRRSDAHAEGAYRETQGRWVLEGSDADPIFLASSVPPKLRQWDVARAGIGAALGALVFAGVFIGGAAIVHRSLPSTGELGPEHEGAASLLAATPLQRDIGLRALRMIWHRSGPLSEDSAERLAALVDQTDGCGGVAAFWNTYGNTVNALVAAQGCPGQRAQLERARAYYARGDMETASDLLGRMHVDGSDLAATGLEPAVSPTSHFLGAARAHLARGRWRTAARSLNAAWGHEGARCVADVARLRAGDPVVDAPAAASRCAVLHASHAAPEIKLAQLEFLSASEPVASLMIHEERSIEAPVVTALPTNVPLGRDALGSPELRRYVETRAQERRVRRAQNREVRRRLHFEIPTDLGCPIDPGAAPAIEHAAFAGMEDMRSMDGAPQRVWAVLAIRQAMFEAVAGNAQAAQALMNRARALNRTSPTEFDAAQTIVDAWNEQQTVPPMSDEELNTAWKGHADDRRVLLQTTAASPLARSLLRYGHDRPVMGTFREHFCDAAAHAVAARRAGLHDFADEQRAIAGLFEQLLRGRRAAAMYWVLDETPRHEPWAD